MRTKKLENSLAQLTKLKNQIRVELNKIRPYHQPVTPEKSSRSAKKLFPERSLSTSLFGPPIESQPTERSSQKKRYELNRVITLGELKESERKHFKGSSKDNVPIKATTRRTNSSYLNIRSEKTNASQAGRSFDNTSLVGVGLKDKSQEKIRPSKRIIGTYHIFNFDLI